MSVHRFFLTDYLPADAEQPLPLSATDVRHAAVVLRVKAGEMIDVVEPAGQAWSVEVTGASALGVHGRVIAPIAPVSAPRVVLFQGVAKGEKMDDVVRQAVEVGADEVVPVLTGRSIVHLDERKRADRGARWRRVAESAAKQAKRTYVPFIDDPLDFRDALPRLADFDGTIVLWEDHRGEGVAQVVSAWRGDPGARIALFVGPEGGLSVEEVDELVAGGARVATLGPSILRTETAAIVALALTIGALGGLGGNRE